MEAANACIATHAQQAIAISFIPLVSVPLVHGLCAKMIVALNEIFGIPADGAEIVSDILTGLVMAPAMAIPLLGAGVSHTYIKSIGQHYAQAVATVLAAATDEERNDNALIAERIERELHNIHQQQRARRMGRRKSGKGAT